MARPLELVNTLLLLAIAVLLAMLVFAPPSPGSSALAPQAQPLALPTIECKVGQLFEEGEQLECIPVRILDAP